MLNKNTAAARAFLHGYMKTAADRQAPLFPPARTMVGQDHRPNPSKVSGYNPSDPWHKYNPNAYDPKSASALAPMHRYAPGGGARLAPGHYYPSPAKYNHVTNHLYQPIPESTGNRIPRGGSEDYPNPIRIPSSYKSRSELRYGPGKSVGSTPTTPTTPTPPVATQVQPGFTDVRAGASAGGARGADIGGRVGTYIGNRIGSGLGAVVGARNASLERGNARQDRRLSRGPAASIRQQQAQLDADRTRMLNDYTGQTETRRPLEADNRALHRLETMNQMARRPFVAPPRPGSTSR